MTAIPKIVIGETIQSNKKRGTRQVFHGRYGDQAAIIKAYSHPSRAFIHWKTCEIHGRIIRKLGIPAPDIWFSGRMAQVDGYAIVYQALPEACDFRWMREALTFTERLPGYQEQLTLFSLMHRRGVAQSDTTPGNFLKSQGQIFAIDEDRMNLRPWPFSRRKSLDNIASMLTQYPTISAKEAESLYEYYAKQRGWRVGKRDVHYLHKVIKRYRAWRADKKGFQRRKLYRSLAYTLGFIVLVSGVWAITASV